MQYLYDYNLAEVKLTFDYIKNTDSVPSEDTACYVGFTLGEKKKKGDLSLDYKYARIERDAVIGSLNDQDFYGANRKGHKVTLSAMLLDRLLFQTAYFYTDPVTAWVPNSTNWASEKYWEHEDRFQVDFVLNF